jgi:HAD superfamily hydrolase (TIGR01662 family)
LPALGAPGSLRRENRRLPRTIAGVRYTTILFDLGDTLIQVPPPAPAYRRLLASHGCPLPLEEVERIVAESRRLTSEQLPPIVAEDLRLNCEAAALRRALHVEHVIRLAGVVDQDAAAEAFLALYVGTGFFTLYPDVPQTLQQLYAAGYQLGIVSNWEPRLPALCAAHGIDRYFQFSVVSELEGYSKPHPHLYRRALELANAAPEQVLHVGDKLREDVEGAAQVGIRTVLLDRAGANPDYQPRITTLLELVRLLDDVAAFPEVPGPSAVGPRAGDR